MKLTQGPKTPKFLEFIRMSQNAYQYLDLYTDRYGDCFQIGGQKNPMVFFSNPEAIETIFTADSGHYYEGKPSPEILGFFEFVFGDRAFDDTSEANVTRNRKLLKTTFTGSLIKGTSMGNCMQRYGQLICDVTNEAISEWKPGHTFYAQSCMKSITINFMLRVLFGLADKKRCEQIKVDFIRLMDFFKSPFYLAPSMFGLMKKDWIKFSPWANFSEIRNRLHQSILAEIRDRRERQDFSGFDALSQLMQYRDDDGQGLTDDEILCFAMVALFNGYETTSSTTTWTLYWIHRKPQVYRKLRAEIDALGPDPNPVEITRLPYLAAACKESRRICPIVINASTRTLKAPMEIMGYEFAPKTQLNPCIYLTHMREDIYPQPKQFRPERFLDRKYSKYEYFPFGGGHAVCSGFALAQAQIQLVIGTLLSRWELALTDDLPAKTEQAAFFTVVPHRNLQMVALQPIKQKVLC